MKPPTAIDLFSGCGGLTLGLKRAGFNVVGAVELDELAAKIYRTNHPEVALLKRDIRRVTGPELLCATGLKRGQLDLLAGCPPCQGFSAMRRLNRRRSARSDQNALIDDFLRLVRSLRPRAVMLENVPYLMKTRRFSSFRAALRRLGYQPTAAVKDAQHYGVPQRRRRLILLAAIKKPVNFAEASPTRLTVRSVIGKLPHPRKSPDRLHSRIARRSDRIERLIRLVPQSGGSRVDLPPDVQLACHQACTGFKDVYGRMSWNDVAPTITGGCFNPSKGRFLHPVQHRAISLREAAMLQGFPRSYRFPASAGTQELATAIGNALPPEFIRRHAQEVKKAVLTTRVRG